MPNIIKDSLRMYYRLCSLFRPPLVPTLLYLDYVFSNWVLAVGTETKGESNDLFDARHQSWTEACPAVPDPPVPGAALPMIKHPGCDNGHSPLLNDSVTTSLRMNTSNDDLISRILCKNIPNL
ncbi:hypothetical protein RRG08_051356 [Elysia crispata]|uniref:Uncharacterized protein n=1 Tax=Elysia crispata TaxID=231223 RepID=A0AAE1B4J5_9GAST|nr:hypothetical protein RRG08_051356 [Elysia crispata]